MNEYKQEDIANKFGYARLGTFIKNGAKIRSGDIKPVFVDKSFEKYLVQEANDIEGWFVTTAFREHGKTIRLMEPVRFDNVEFTLLYRPNV